jgi:hypothetical protein
MLKVELDDKNEKAIIEFSGTLRNAIADSTYIINNLHEHLCANDPIAGLLFRLKIQALISDDKSPVWELDNQENGIKSVEIKIPDGFQMPSDE